MYNTGSADSNFNRATHQVGFTKGMLMFTAWLITNDPRAEVNRPTIEPLYDY